jgi:hypothetical protein
MESADVLGRSKLEPSPRPRGSRSGGCAPVRAAGLLDLSRPADPKKFPTYLSHPWVGKKQLSQARPISERFLQESVSVAREGAEQLESVSRVFRDVAIHACPLSL